MSSTLLVDRTSITVPGATAPGYSPTGVTTPTGVPVSPNFLMVPKCTYKVEKCTGGLKISCHCDDKVACSVVQNLCNMLAGGLCSCSVTMNGQCVFYCNFNLGMCKCETTEDGCCVTYTSGDPKCCEMIQACCDCLTCLLDCGCTCCLLINGTPIGCGSCETPKKTAKSKA